MAKKKTTTRQIAPGKKKITFELDGMTIAACSELTEGTPAKASSFASMKLSTLQFENAVFGHSLEQSLSEGADVQKAFDQGMRMVLQAIAPIVEATRKHYAVG